MLSVQLKHSQVAAPVALVRRLTGSDESALRGNGLGAAVSLVSRLLVPSPAALEVEELTALAVADLDRIVLRLQESLYGDSLECRSTCRACGEGFEFALPVASLVKRPSLESSRVRPDPARRGVYVTEDGVCFRLPTVLEALQKVEAETLSASCVVGDKPFASTKEADSAFAVAGPLACETLESVCPHCSAQQLIALDLVDYLMDMLARERPFLIHETHRIACTYGWSLREIQSLDREDRRAFVRLIAQEAAARSRAGRRVA